MSEKKLASSINIGLIWFVVATSVIFAVIYLKNSADASVMAVFGFVTATLATWIITFFNYDCYTCGWKICCHNCSHYNDDSDGGDDEVPDPEDRPIDNLIDNFQPEIAKN